MRGRIVAAIVAVWLGLLIVVVAGSQLIRAGESRRTPLMTKILFP